MGISLYACNRTKDDSWSVSIVDRLCVFKVRANGRNIVGQQLPCTCCVCFHTLLHVVAFVGSCGAKFETSQTFSPVQTGATLLVVQCCFRLYAALPSCWYRVIFGFVNVSANFSKSYKLLADRKRSRGPRLGFLSGEAWELFMGAKQRDNEAT